LRVRRPVGVPSRASTRCATSAPHSPTDRHRLRTSTCSHHKIGTWSANRLCKPLPILMAEGGAFLPRILSVFYAVLDVKSGPKILYQVPEDLIPPSRQTPSSAFNSFSPPPARTPAVKSSSDASSGNPFDSPVSIQVVSPTSMVGPDRPKRIPFRRAVSGSASKLKGPLPVLFFEDISSYVIPASALCGRLVKCSTRDHRIIGFPVELRGDYEREEFRYNVCFVFLKTADLSCYEVRHLSS
jgi:hypothetical protein